MKENVKMVAINIGALEASLGQIGESSLAKSLKHLLGDLHDDVESEAEEISSRIRAIIKLLQCIKLKEQTPDFVMYRVIKDAFNALNELVEDHIGFDDDLERDLLLFSWNESVIDVLDEIVSDREALLFGLTIVQAESFDDTHSTDTYVESSMYEGICPAFLGGFNFDKEAYNTLMSQYANDKVILPNSGLEIEIPKELHKYMKQDDNKIEADSKVKEMFRDIAPLTHFLVTASQKKKHKINLQNLIDSRHNTEDKKPPLGFVEHNGHLLPHNSVYGLLGLSLCSPAKPFSMTTDLTGLFNKVMGDDEGVKGLAVKKVEKQEEKKITAGVDLGVSEGGTIFYDIDDSKGVKDMSDLYKTVDMLNKGMVNLIEIIDGPSSTKSVTVTRGGIVTNIKNGNFVFSKVMSDNVNSNTIKLALDWLKGAEDNRIVDLKFLHDCMITFDIPRLLHVLLGNGTIDINTSSLNGPTNINTMVELAAYLAKKFNIDFGPNAFKTHVDLIHLIMDIIEVNGGVLNIEIKKGTHLRYYTGEIVDVMTPSGAIMKLDYKIQEGNVKSQRELFIEALKQIHIGEVK